MTETAVVCDLFKLKVRFGHWNFCNWSLFWNLEFVIWNFSDRLPATSHQLNGKGSLPSPSFAGLLPFHLIRRRVLKSPTGCSVRGALCCLRSVSPEGNWDMLFNLLPQCSQRVQFSEPSMKFLLEIGNQFTH